MAEMGQTMPPLVQAVDQSILNTQLQHKCHHASTLSRTSRILGQCLGPRNQTCRILMPLFPLLTTDMKTTYTLQTEMLPRNQHIRSTPTSLSRSNASYPMTQIDPLLKLVMLSLLWEILT